MSTLRLQIDALPDGGWHVSAAHPNRPAERHLVAPEVVRAALRLIGRLDRSTDPGLAVRGADREVCTAEEQVGQCLAGLVFPGPLAAELGRATALRRPALLAIDTRSPKVQALPWELLAAHPGALPLESCGDAVIARLVAASERPGPRDLALRLWVADPADPALAAVAGAVREAAARHQLPAPAPVEEPLPGDCAALLVLVCHGEQLGRALSLSGVDAAPNTLLHQLQPLLSRTELAIAAVCEGASLSSSEPWTTRVVESGARACLGPCGPLRVEAAREMIAGAFAAIGAGGSAIDAAAGARRAVRALAHPARSARWHRLVLTLGALGAFGPMFKAPPEIPGWSPPGPEAAPVLEAALQAAEERGDGFLGVEHLLFALAGAPNVPPMLRWRAEPARQAAAVVLAGLRVLGGTAPAPAPTPRMRRIGAALPPGFGLQALWRRLEEDAWAVLARYIPMVPRAAGPVDTDSTRRGGERPADFLEVVGGPEDGRELRLRPGESLGRYAEPPLAEHLLYQGTVCTDVIMSRKHLVFVRSGELELLSGRNGRFRVELHAETLLPLTSLTAIVGRADPP